MRLFQTERTQEDSSFVESCQFSLEGRVVFEHSGVGLGRAFQREGKACAGAEYANASVYGQQCGQSESTGEFRESKKDGGGIFPLHGELWNCSVNDLTIC